jgi:hypothetical protein
MANQHVFAHLVILVIHVNLPILVQQNPVKAELAFHKSLIIDLITIVRAILHFPVQIVILVQTTHVLAIHV